MQDTEDTEGDKNNCASWPGPLLLLARNPRCVQRRRPGILKLIERGLQLSGGVHHRFVLERVHPERGFFAGIEVEVEELACAVEFEMPVIRLLHGAAAAN